MNAHKFVAEHGVEKARAVLDGAPSKAQRYFLGKYFKQGEWTWWWSSYLNKWLQFEKHIYGDSKFEIAVDLSELKQVVESVEIVEQFGNDLVGTKQLLDFAKDCKTIELSGSVITVARLEQAIADHELVESYKQVKVEISFGIALQSNQSIGAKCEVLDMVDVSPRCEVINETH